MELPDILCFIIRHFHAAGPWGTENPGKNGERETTCSWGHHFSHPSRKNGQERFVHPLQSENGISAAQGARLFMGKICPHPKRIRSVDPGKPYPLELDNVLQFGPDLRLAYPLHLPFLREECTR
jgi:hypothetical protein